MPLVKVKPTSPGRRGLVKVVRVDAARGLLLVKGAVPGADGGHIVIRPAVKAPAKKGD